MKIVYSSGLGCPKIIDDKFVLEQVDNSTDFVDNIKRNLKGVKKMVFISNRWDKITSLAQPGDEVFTDFHYTNEEYAKAVRTCFAKAKLVFNEMVIVDGEYNGNLKKELKDADFVYIQGGHTTRGLKVLEDLKFKNALEEFDGTILVTGTAAKLLATKILSTQNLVDFNIEKGLGIKDYSVRPFFKHTLKYKFKKGHRTRVRLLKNFSKEIDVYAMGYLSYIIDLGHELQFYGPCYLFKNGKLRKVKKTSTR